MTFQAGQIANPLGAGALGRGRPFSDALNRALSQNGGKKLRALADKLIAMGLDGDMQAIKEIVNRLEGLPRQAIDVAGTDGVTIVMMQRPTITGEKPEPRVIDIPPAGERALLNRR